MVRPDARQRKRMYGVWRESGGVVERRRFEVCGVGMCVGVWVWVSGGEGGGWMGGTDGRNIDSEVRLGWCVAQYCTYVAD